MSIQQLLIGAKGGAVPPGVITITDQELISTGEASQLRSEYQLNSNGRAYGRYEPIVPSWWEIEEWVDPPAAAPHFEVQVVKVAGGATVNGTLGAWLPLTSTYQWYIQANTLIGQVAVADLAVTIRRVGQTTPEATVYVDLRVYS